MQSQYDHQYQMKSRIDQYHREAIRAEQIHSASATQPKRIDQQARKWWTSVRSVLTAAQAYFSRKPVISPEMQAGRADTGVTA